jgi:hypothetical protein
MGRSKDPILSVRLPDDLQERLQKCADALDLSQNDIARHAIPAAVAEIEKNGGRLIIPPDMELQFRVASDLPAAPRNKRKVGPTDDTLAGPHVPKQVIAIQSLSKDTKSDGSPSKKPKHNKTKET